MSGRGRDFWADRSMTGERQGARVRATMLLAALMIAAPAVAQSINPYRQTAPIMASDTDDGSYRATANVPGLGGFGGRGLTLSASLTTRYESNLARLPTSDDGLRILPQVNFGYGLGGSRLGFFVEGYYGRDIVRGNNFLRGGDRSKIAAGVDVSLSRCTAELGGSYRRNLNLLNDAAQFGSFQIEQTTYGVTAQCGFGSALSVNGGFSQSDSSNATGSSALNFQSTNFNAGVSLGSAAFGQVQLQGSLSNVDMPGRQVITPNGIVDESLQQRSLRLGVQRNFGSRITVSLGASLIDSKPGVESSLVIVEGVPQFVDRTGFSGLGYDAALGLNLSSRLNFEFSVGRSANANPFVGALVVVADSISAGVSSKLGRLDVSAGMTWRRNDFRGGFVSDFDPVARRRDTMTSYFLRFGGRLGRLLRYSLELNHNRRDSNPAVLNFTSTGVGLNLGMNFGKGSR